MTARARTSVATIGHSTRPIDEMIELLRAHGVARVVDIRTIPRSRANPQYDGAALPRSLRRAKLGYTHLAALGGLRRPRPDSEQNAAWRNRSFRGYADYMQTPEFAAGLDELLALARAEPVAILCAEAVPWRCHRSLVADALTARGVAVAHIMSRTRAQPHAMTSFAKRRGRRVTYPAPPAAPEPKLKTKPKTKPRSKPRARR